MGAFEGVSLFLSRPLDQVAEEFGYDEDNVLILRGDQDTLCARYPETYKNIVSCKYHADKRTYIEYARDLVASWLIEDYFLENLQSDYYVLSLNGADKNRKILSNTKTSASSDFLVSTPDVAMKLELMNDYTGFWRKEHVLHLRDSKYIELQKNGSLLVAISMSTEEFAIYDFREEVYARKLESHWLYGGKPAYEISIPAERLQPITENSIKNSIIKLLQ